MVELKKSNNKMKILRSNLKSLSNLAGAVGLHPRCNAQDRHCLQDNQSSIHIAAMCFRVIRHLRWMALC